MPGARNRSVRYSACFLLVVNFTVVLLHRPAVAQLQPAPPPLRAVEPPPDSWSADQLDQRADVLRADKLYLDALDYYRAALRKDERNPLLYNKAGITELQMQRYKDAEKDFHRSIKINKKYSEAYNNLGVIYYLHKKYGKAIKQYRKAIALNDLSASFHSNLATAYFSKKDFPKAIAEYQRALQLDPNILERTSSAGVEAQLSSPEDRAHYDYMLAKMYAAMGASDRSLLYLRKAMEEGYKGINSVYKDAEFSGLRKDPRFNTLMGARPPAIPE